MARKREITNADDIINAYITGANISDLLKNHGISDCLLSRLLRDAGVKRRTRQEAYALKKGNRAKSRVKLNDSDICKRYTSGDSEKSIAEFFNVSRATIRRILEINNVNIRGRSDAEKLKWKKIKSTPGGVERQCKAAWEAADSIDDELEESVLKMYKNISCSKSQLAEVFNTSRGNISRILRKNGIKNDKAKIRQAQGVMRESESNPICSVYELPIINAIIEQGLKPIHQYAVGTCNVDIAFPEFNIVVEIERRYAADSHSLRRQRLEHIFNAGWLLLVVYDPRKKGIDATRVAQQIIRFINVTSLNPSPCGQYGVISCDGEPRAIRTDNFNGWARIKGF